MIPNQQKHLTGFELFYYITVHMHQQYYYNPSSIFVFLVPAPFLLPTQPHINLNIVFFSKFAIFIHKRTNV